MSGVLSMILGIACFAAADAIGKWVVTDYSVFQVLAVRSVLAVLILLLLAPVFGGREVVRTRQPAAHVARALSSTLAFLFFFASVRVLPLADAVAVEFGGPFIVMALSVPLLGEHVDRGRWIAVDGEAQRRRGAHLHLPRLHHERSGPGGPPGSVLGLEQNERLRFRSHLGDGSLRSRGSARGYGRVPESSRVGRGALRVHGARLCDALLAPHLRRLSQACRLDGSRDHRGRGALHHPQGGRYSVSQSSMSLRAIEMLEGSSTPSRRRTSSRVNHRASSSSSGCSRISRVLARAVNPSM